MTRKSGWRLVGRALLGAAALAALGLACSLGWLKLHENELVFQTARSHLRATQSLPADAERITLTPAAGASVAGALYRADPASDNGYWVLHFHGNADSAFSKWQIRDCEALRRIGFGVLDIDYRGFGLSPGTASEPGMYEDAEAAFQALLERKVPQNRIIIWGHSLGSGPAVMLASRHHAAALVLFGAFTSLPDAAADAYPGLPVRWLTAEGFDSIDRIAAVHMPVVIAHSRADTLIPYRHALRLFAAAHEPKRLLTLDGVAHDGYGGHVDALYDHLDLLAAQLAQLLPGISAPR
ncbi:MAG: alpha/beta hydrolase [Steroidobacteraceae bacterium]